MRGRKSLPRQRIYEERVLLQVLLQRILLRQDACRVCLPLLIVVHVVLAIRVVHVRLAAQQRQTVPMMVIQCVMIRDVCQIIIVGIVVVRLVVVVMIVVIRHRLQVRRFRILAIFHVIQLLVRVIVQLKVRRIGITQRARAASAETAVLRRVNGATFPRTKT